MNSMRGNNKRGPLIVGMALITSALVSAPSANGLPFDPDGERKIIADTVSNHDRMVRQQPLIEAADQVRAVVERGNDSGYAGIILEEGRVALWWKGDVPAPVRAAIAEQTVEFRVAQARYSLAELEVAAKQARERFDADPNSPVHTVKIPSDGRGLVYGSHPGTGTRAQASAAEQRKAGVAVEVVEEVEAKPVSREDDWSPWKAGAVTINETAGTACTSGFGVRDSDGGHYIATAAHCGASGDRITDGTGEWIGDTGDLNEEHDVALIPTSEVEYFVYLDAMDSDLGATVEGWSSAYPGQIVCQSGVTSEKETGEPVCNIEVVNVNSDAAGMVEADQLDGEPGARSGDSGGPVYGASESGNAVAVGITSAVAGSRLVFQDFVTVMEDFGVGL